MGLRRRDATDVLKGAFGRAAAAYRIARYGVHNPDLVVPYRSVLFELSQSGARPCNSTQALMRELASQYGWDLEACSLGELRSLDTREVGPRSFPEYFDTEGETLELLRQIVICSKPNIVVETGVANGVSTRVILSALRANGQGRLVSFDVDPIARDAVPDERDREKWEFELLASRPDPHVLEERIKRYAGEIDLWYHDSDHSYRWQREEFEIASKVLKRPGFLIADDVDGNGAFSDFIASRGLQAWYIFDGRKCSGLAIVTPP